MIPDDSDFNPGYASGSRQAPDPYDQFLEKDNFYRKHTPRDPSSLFRCISEQLFDTQMYYQRVRGECCEYMKRNRDYFESHVDGCFDEYMQNMASFRGRGTLLELRALAYRYHRNVILFEPYNLGNSFIQQAQYGKNTFRVFVAPDYHFDSVFTREEIQDAAYCQSLVYETLYSGVFKLPDVAYAVERMLHDQLGVRITEEKEDKVVQKAITDDGREFVFDYNPNTSCILEDYRMCHFHNEAFGEYVDSLQATGDDNQQQIQRSTNSSQVDCTKSTYNGRPRYLDSLLKAADASCVRQLLNDGITPFPYKVAKALDQNIYRNIEFDVWSEMRRLHRSKYMYRRYISVGDKCFIRLIEGDSNSPKALVKSQGGGGNDENKSTATTKVYVGYVQYIEKFSQMYHVYVEELGERLVVHGNTVRSCPKNPNVAGKEFTVIGLNGGGRVFNKYWGPYSYYRHGNTNYRNNTCGGSMQQPQRTQVRGFRNGPYYRHTSFYYARRFITSSNQYHNHDVDDDLVKKKKAITNNIDSSSIVAIANEKCTTTTTTSIFNNNLSLKDILASPYYDAASSYMFSNDIIAMPMFISGKKPETVVEEERNNKNKDNSKRDKDTAEGLPFETKSEHVENVPEDSIAVGMSSEIPAGVVVEDESQIKLPTGEEHAYDQYQASQQATILADPNGIYGQQQQFYSAQATTYYMPLDVNGANTNAYLNPCYRSNGPYYCNYVYNAAGTPQQNMTPYLVNNTNPNGTTAYVAAPNQPTVSGSFDPQSIPIQSAIRRRDLLYTDAPVNANASPSYSTKGEDLPLNDMSSLRFYYNLGIECFAYMSSMQGATNALNSLQSGPGNVPTGDPGSIPVTTPAVATPPAAIMPSPNTGNTSQCVIANDVSQDLKALSIESNKRTNNNSTPGSETTGAGTASSTASANPSTTRNSTPSSVSQGETGRNYQGPGYRRPPFYNHRGGYARNNHFGGYRGGMQQQHSQQGGEKGKDTRGPVAGGGGTGTSGGGYQYNNHYNNRNNFRGRYNNNYHNNNLGQRKPSTGNANDEEKNQSQSPFQNNNQNNRQQVQSVSSPVVGHGKNNYSNSGGGQSQNQNQYMQQQQQQQHGSEYGNGGQQQRQQDNQQNQQLMTPPANYYGGPQQFPFSGPPPHLPPPFGSSTNNQQAGTQQVMGLPQSNVYAQGQQQQGTIQQPIYNSPFYTYAYYPVEMAGQDAGSNVIVQPMAYMPTGSPYQNQQMMGVNNQQQIHQQLSGTPPNSYYAPISGGEPVTPLLHPVIAPQATIAWATTTNPSTEGVQWSSTTGGTPVINGHSGTSSGIGSTESSPPYGSGQSAAVNYPYPPPTHHQAQQPQQLWYPSPSTGGGGTGVVGQPQPAATIKVEGKSSLP